MPELVVEQPLMKIITEKNKFIDGLLAGFESEYGAISKEILGELKRLYLAGQLTYDSVIQLFQAAGFDDMIAGFVEQYTGLMGFVSQEAKYMGLDFALSERGLDLIGMMQQQTFDTLGKYKELYINKIIQTGIKAFTEGKTASELLADTMGNLDSLWRNYKLEISEGIKLFDRTIHSEQMREAGIEKFVYVGPDDDRTRGICKQILDDPHQNTGWTREDIAESPVSFIGGGGWNCRHDFYPYIEEYK